MPNLYWQNAPLFSHPNCSQNQDNYLNILFCKPSFRVDRLFLVDQTTLDGWWVWMIAFSVSIAASQSNPSVLATIYLKPKNMYWYCWRLSYLSISKGLSEPKTNLFLSPFSNTRSKNPCSLKSSTSKSIGFSLRNLLMPSSVSLFWKMLKVNSLWPKRFL